MAYPWRAVWQFREPDDDRPDTAQFVITVPKRRLRHAVDRVTMRRRMREAYRLHRHLLPPGSGRLDIAFIYIAPRLTPYAASVRALEKIFAHITIPSVR